MKDKRVLYVSSEVVPYLPETEISSMSFEAPRQAKNGIRYLVRSRGLEDMFKRQTIVNTDALTFASQGRGTTAYPRCIATSVCDLRSSTGGG